MNNPIKLFFKEENSEKTPNYNSSETNQSNPIETVKVDLRELGYTKAGATGGNLESLKNLMQDISNGYFIDVNEDEETQQKEKQKIKGEIDILNVEKSHQEGELKKILLTDIPNSNSQISDLNQEKINLEIEYEKSKNNTTRNNFNLNLYWPVFIAATIFLYGFYLSAFHTAFFKDINKAASEADSNNISELLNTVFNVEAFKSFNLHWFAPIIFFVFSIGLHIILDADKKYRLYLFIGALIFILIADCLIAYFIENNSHIIQVLNGMGDENWLFYKSPRFYLVLFLGFFTCLGWSLILHAIKVEYEKKDGDGILKKEKQIINSKEIIIKDKISALNKSAIDIEASINKIRIQIESKTDQLQTVFYSKSSLNKRITAYYDGWLSFVTGLKNNHDLITEAERIKSEFLNQTITIQNNNSKEN